MPYTIFNSIGSFTEIKMAFLMKKINNIQLLTFSEIEKRVETIPAVILPVGGMEPVGEWCALGAVNKITHSISETISNNCSVLLQPVLLYGNTTSFRAFGGSSGVKKNIFESLITGIVKDCASWGIKHIFIIDGTCNSYPTLQKVVKRVSKNKKMAVDIHIFNWQREEKVRNLISKQLKGNELSRTEFGILSMISHLNPSMIRKNKGRKKAKSLCTDDVYRKWYKLGQDPDKFRKLFPDCSTSIIDNDIDPTFGKELFTYITNLFSKEVKKRLKVLR